MGGVLVIMGAASRTRLWMGLGVSVAMVVVSWRVSVCVVWVVGEFGGVIFVRV